MSETGNITQHDFLFMKQGKDSVGMMYVDLIRELQARYDNLEARYNTVCQEKEKLKVLADLLKKQNDHLIEEVNELNSKIEEAVSQKHIAIKPDSETMPDINVTNSPRVANRKPKQQPINTDIVKRLKSDRRHYAVACDAALFYWQLLIDNGLMNQNLRPTPQCGVTVAARIVCCFQNVVDPNIRWSFFEMYWKMKHLQSNLHRCSYRDEKKYALVNRIFGRADDAPFIPKSQIDLQ